MTKATLMRQDQLAAASDTARATASVVRRLHAQGIVSRDALRRFERSAIEAWSDYIGAVQDGLRERARALG